jgi:hypothetical protein
MMNVSIQGATSTPLPCIDENDRTKGVPRRPRLWRSLETR